MDTATTQPAKTIPDKGIGAGDVISGVLAGLVCGVLAVFVLAWTQGGAADFDLDSLIESARAVLQRIYPL